MDKNNDSYKKFQESLEHLQGHFHVLETTIPVEKQMEFFRYSEKLREQDVKQPVEESINLLNSEDASEESKKEAMSLLAISGDVKAYRALESYQKQAEENLKDWANMSLLQAKITLESEFSDEKQIFISTGLGGKGELLRFFAFFKAKDLNPFSAYQIQLIEKEIPFHIHEAHGIVEELKVSENYFTITFLINIKTDIKYMLENAIAECNQYGDFIDGSFIVTNVRKFNEEEINKELSK